MVQSACMNPKYFRSNFVPQATVKWRGKTISVPDGLDYSYQKVLASLNPVYSADKIDENVTAIAYSLYGNTSIFWAILALNGFFNPIALKDGVEVKYPDISQVLTTNTSNSTSSNSSTATKDVTI